MTEATLFAMYDKIHKRIDTLVNAMAAQMAIMVRESIKTRRRTFFGFFEFLWMKFILRKKEPL